MKATLRKVRGARYAGGGESLRVLLARLAAT